MRSALFSTLSTIAIAGSLGAPALAADNGQLAASAGIEPAAAASLTLDQIAAIKFNNDAPASDFQTVPGSFDREFGVSGRGQDIDTLSAAAARHFNASMSGDDQQTVVRPVAGGPNDRSQLAAVAGIDGAEAGDMTLDGLAKAFFAATEG